MQKIVLLINSFLLSACVSRPLPLNYVYVIDIPHGVCAKKEIIDRENLIFKHVEDLPLMDCDGNISIDSSEWLGLKDWIKWAIQEVKKQHAK